MPPSPLWGEGRAIWAAHREIGGSRHGPRTAIAPRRRQPREPHGTVTRHKRQHQWGRSQSRSAQAGPPQPRIPREKGVYRGEPPIRALWLLSLAREKVTPAGGAPPAGAPPEGARGPQISSFLYSLKPSPSTSWASHTIKKALGSTSFTAALMAVISRCLKAHISTSFSLPV